MKEISLPNYVKALPQNVVDKLSMSPEAEKLIIACGVHPDDGSLVMITGEGGVFSIKPNGRMRPRQAGPTHTGEHISIVFHDPYGLHLISSQAALAIAKDEFLDTQIFARGNSLGRLTSEEDV